MADDMITPDEWAPPPPDEPHDHKGLSEEKCVRCGWVMGHRPLNCMNDNTPHRFPSQEAEIERLASRPASRNRITRRSPLRRVNSIETIVWRTAADEIERLRAEVAELQEGQLTNRWPLHKMLAAERELADKLARALRSVIHDKPTAHTDEVWLRIHKALEAHEEARRG